MSCRQNIADSNSSLSARIKRHLKYGDICLCIFTTWDANKNKVVARNKRHHTIVHLLHLLHFLSIWTQLYCTRTKATDILEIAEAIGFTTMISASFVIEAEIYPDWGQVSMLNYICKKLSEISFFEFLTKYFF